MVPIQFFMPRFALKSHQYIPLSSKCIWKSISCLQDTAIGLIAHLNMISIFLCLHFFRAVFGDHMCRGKNLEEKTNVCFAIWKRFYFSINLFGSSFSNLYVVSETLVLSHLFIQCTSIQRTILYSVIIEKIELNEDLLSTSKQSSFILYFVIIERIELNEDLVSILKKSPPLYHLTTSKHDKCVKYFISPTSQINMLCKKYRWKFIRICEKWHIEFSDVRLIAVTQKSFNYSQYFQAENSAESIMLLFEKLSLFGDPTKPFAIFKPQNLRINFF